MEVSSQALKYKRTMGITFDVGAFLNIGIDHISDVEHEDFEDYFESKLKLIGQSKTVCINRDIEKFDKVLEMSKGAEKTVTFGQRATRASVGCWWGMTRFSSCGTRTAPRFRLISPVTRAVSSTWRPSRARMPTDGRFAT